MNDKVLMLRGEEWPEPSIRQIPYWEIESVWDDVSPMLQKAIDVQDEWTLEGIKTGLMQANSHMQLWKVGSNGAIVTIIQTFQTGIKKCLLFLAGGTRLEDSLHAPKVIESWAIRYFGVHKMIIHGRKGWIKKLEGYELSTVCLEKRL